jgi:hypothetical protein
MRRPCWKWIFDALAEQGTAPCEGCAKVVPAQNRLRNGILLFEEPVLNVEPGYQTTGA